jgi:hypothetical protein
MKSAYKKQRKMKITSNYDTSMGRITQLEQQVEQLNNQIGYCLAYLNKLGIPTDVDSLETYLEYSCDNHYNW